jgi:hypothetical protein
MRIFFVVPVARRWVNQGMGGEMERHLPHDLHRSCDKWGLWKVTRWRWVSEELVIFIHWRRQTFLYNNGVPRCFIPLIAA